MLAIVGLFGVMMAGLVADALISHGNDEPADPADLPEDDEPSLADGNLLDDVFADPTIPTSDDIEDPEDEDASVNGTENVDLLEAFGGSDQISAGEGSDLINSRGGNDHVASGAGNDGVWAGDGNDSVWADEGNDSVYGDAGDDTLSGGDGKDSLAGCEGDDSLIGGAGNDSLLGGQGDDWLDGGEDDDWLSGGDGNDYLSGKAGSDVLDGGTGDDTISGVETEGGQQTDFVNGGDGNDQLILGAGDFASGGDGSDEFVLQEWLNESAVTQISDYDPGHDRLVIVYDASVHTYPELTVEPNLGGSGHSIFIDGSKVAVVIGAPITAANIQLSPA